MATRSELANALRALAMDAVQKANSGHPGMPMGMAEIAEVRVAPPPEAQPGQSALGRTATASCCPTATARCCSTRCCISPATHLPMEELKRFRQLHSKTPGHPEIGCAPGVETTTGSPRPGPRQCGRHGDRRTRARGRVQSPRARHRRSPHLGVPRRRLPDGRHLARSLLARRHAEARQADRRCTTTTASPSTPKGSIESWFTDDTPKRFEAYGWHVIRDVDGHDVDAVDAAVRAAKAVTDRPSLDLLQDRSSARARRRRPNTGDAHGAPLGEKEVAATRADIGWKHPPFEIPQDIRDGWDARESGAAAGDGWNASFARLPQGASPKPPRSSSAAWPANCRRTGASTRRRSSMRRSRRPRPSPRARPRRTRSTASARRCRN